MTTNQSDQQTTRQSRRRFFGTVGAGAAGAVAAGAAVGAGLHPHHAYAQMASSNNFSRMFQLPPFAESTPPVRQALLQMGKQGGLLDARDQLARGPVDLITDLSLSVNSPNHPTHTAGVTFMGQFMDHDITFDMGSHLGVATAPETATNGRTAAFDLDSVYGGGPMASPHLYDPADQAKLKVESGGLFEDLPRTAENTAIIGDPRNDEHVIIAGLQAAFLLFHNRVVDHLRARGGADDRNVFARARRLTTWHYQWLILHEILPQFIGQPLVDDILTHGRRFYTARRNASIPVEFQGAAYRFGHSMIRPSYRANLAGDHGQPFFGLIFDPAEEGIADPADLRGGARAPRRFIGWQTFFDFGDGEVKPNKKIDTHISTPLFNLPLGAIASHDLPTSLPQRTLLRGLTWGLPSGQAIARAMDIPALAPQDLAELAGFGMDFERSTPLFYYVLREAELLANGLHLGPVGGRIVGEVIIGLLEADPASYLAAQPGWRPTLPSRSGTGAYRMVDFLTFAGVDPTSRGQ